MKTIKKYTILKEFSNKIELPERVRHIQTLHMRSLNKLPRKIDDVNKYKYIFKALRDTSHVLVLWYAQFKCEKCGVEEELTIHHMILRHVKKYTSYIHYVKQRYYFGNQLCLCLKCHAKLHKIDTEKLKTISKIKIENIKKIFGVRE